MAEYTRKEKAQLRDLAGEAYERELGQRLLELDKSFAAWRRGKMPSSLLSDEIHHFHQHDAREVWSAYQNLDESTLVARAVARGILKASDVPTTLREKLKSSIALLKGESGAD